MSFLTWLYVLGYGLCWVVFFILIRKTQKLGYRVRSLVFFWTSLVSLSFGSLATVALVLWEV